MQPSCHHPYSSPSSSIPVGISRLLSNVDDHHSATTAQTTLPHPHLVRRFVVDRLLGRRVLSLETEEYARRRSILALEVSCSISISISILGFARTGSKKWKIGLAVACLGDETSSRARELELTLLYCNRPYGLYSTIDLVYGLEAFQRGDGFASAQCLSSLVSPLPPSLLTPPSLSQRFSTSLRIPSIYRTSLFTR